MADKEVHPVVELLLARIKSHPEEFTSANDHEDRWGYAITTVEDYGSVEDKAALEERLRSIRLNEAHEWAMDELLNGEERREREREDSQRIKDLNAKMGSMQQYAQLQASQYAQAAQLAGSTQLGGLTANANVIGQIKKHLGLK